MGLSAERAGGVSWRSLLLPLGFRLQGPHPPDRHGRLPALPDDRRIRLLLHARRHPQDRRVDSRRKGADHARTGAFSDERKPGEISRIPAAGAPGYPAARLGKPPPGSGFTSPARLALTYGLPGRQSGCCPPMHPKQTALSLEVITVTSLEPPVVPPTLVPPTQGVDACHRNTRKVEYSQIQPDKLCCNIAIWLCMRKFCATIKTGRKWSLQRLTGTIPRQWPHSFPGFKRSVVESARLCWLKV